ncbi:MAG: hypothetical protein SFU87_17440 [Chitinophagaceae bacterium]|nr:hypothetical protein [Chitinophagaceae bacterium]
MANKKNFVLRIDEDIYAALEKWAADEFRSVNGQIEWVIHQKLKETARMPPAKNSPSSKSAKPSK